MQIAVAVEKIQVSVHTVVELVDIRNKAHFRWTKVDELIADEEFSVKLIAQGIRHISADHYLDSKNEHLRESLLLNVYRQIVQPGQEHPQLFRVNLSWPEAKHLTFNDLIAKGTGAPSSSSRACRIPQT